MIAGRPTTYHMTMMAVTIGLLTGCGTTDSDSQQPTVLGSYEVRRDNLEVTVLEQGQLVAERSVAISSQVRGTITMVVEEGSQVAAGDVLITLDDKEQLRKKEDQELKVERDQRSLAEAEADKVIYELDIKRRLEDAARQARFAKLDHQQYIDGTAPLRERDLVLQVERAEVDAVQAAERLELMPELLAEDFVTSAEVREAELKAKETAQEVETKQANLTIFKDLERPRESENLAARAAAAEVSLASLKQEQVTELARKDAAIASAAFTLRRSQDALAKLEGELAQMVITAPEDGIVVYGDGSYRRSRAQVEVGDEARRNRVLMRLPDLSRMRVEIGVDESYISQIAVGQQVNITVEGMNLELSGEVTFIATTATEDWRSEVKEYLTKVSLLDVPDGTEFRPGMTVAAEIVTGVFPDRLLVPIAAVQHDDEGSFIYGHNGGDLARIAVTVAESNDQWVAIEGDVTAGSKVAVVAAGEGDA